MGYVQESQGKQKLMDRLSSSVRQAQTSFMLKDVDPEFAKQLAYFSELGDKMSVLERIGARLHSEREELQAALDDFSVALFHWAANEQVMAQPLQKLANCVEHCSHHVKKLVYTYVCVLVLLPVIATWNKTDIIAPVMGRCTNGFSNGIRTSL